MSVVVVTYRSAAYVADCLGHVAAALRGLSTEVVVVDSASDDGVVDVVQAESERLGLPVRVVVRERNEGFAAACHSGAEVSTGRYLLLVNPDVTVDPGSVRALLAAAAAHPRAGLLGGRAVNADGTTAAHSWWGRPTLWSTLCFATGLSSAFPGHPLLDPETSDRWDGSEREVDVVSGGFVLIDRSAWTSLGGFDRSFLLYGEDADLCLRAKDAGWRPRVVPEATFRHQVGSSSTAETRPGLVLRGRASVVRRHLRPGTRRLGVALLVAGCGLRAAAAGSLARRPGGRERTSAAGWQHAWNARREWSRGWRAGDTLEVAS